MLKSFGYKVFLDEKEIPSGDASDRLQYAIQNSRNFLILIANQDDLDERVYEEGDWFVKEWIWASDNKNIRQFKVCCIEPGSQTNLPVSTKPINEKLTGAFDFFNNSTYAEFDFIENEEERKKNFLEFSINHFHDSFLRTLLHGSRGKFNRLYEYPHDQPEEHGKGEQPIVSAYEKSQDQPEKNNSGLDLDPDYFGKIKANRQTFSSLPDVLDCKDYGENSLLLYGPGGSGKSFHLFNLWEQALKKIEEAELLRHEASAVAVSRADEGSKETNWIPLYLNMDDYDSSQNSILSELSKTYFPHSNFSNNESFSRFMRTALDHHINRERNYKYLILLDGINQALISNDFHKELKTLDDMPNCRVVCTARERAYYMNSIPLELQPLTDEQINEVIRKSGKAEIDVLDNAYLLRYPFYLKLYVNTDEKKTGDMHRINSASLIRDYLETQIRRRTAVIQNESFLPLLLFVLPLAMVHYSLGDPKQYSGQEQRVILGSDSTTIFWNKLILLCMEVLRNNNYSRIEASVLNRFKDIVKIADWRQKKQSLNNFEKMEETLLDLMLGNLHIFSLDQEKLEYKWAHETYRDWFVAEGLHLLLLNYLREDAEEDVVSEHFQYFTHLLDRAKAEQSNQPFHAKTHHYTQVCNCLYDSLFERTLDENYEPWRHSRFDLEFIRLNDLVLNASDDARNDYMTYSLALKSLKVYEQRREIFLKGDHLGYSPLHFWSRQHETGYIMGRIRIQVIQKILTEEKRADFWDSMWERAEESLQAIQDIVEKEKDPDKLWVAKMALGKLYGNRGAYWLARKNTRSGNLQMILGDLGSALQEHRRGFDHRTDCLKLSIEQGDQHKQKEAEEMIAYSYTQIGTDHYYIAAIIFRKTDFKISEFTSAIATSLIQHLQALEIRSRLDIRNGCINATRAAGTLQMFFVAKPADADWCCEIQTILAHLKEQGTLVTKMIKILSSSDDCQSEDCLLNPLTYLEYSLKIITENEFFGELDSVTDTLAKLLKNLDANPTAFGMIDQARLRQLAEEVESVCEKQGYLLQENREVIQNYLH